MFSSVFGTFSSGLGKCSSAKTSACGDLFKNNRAGLIRKPDGPSPDRYNLEGTFKGTITPDRFEQIAKLIVDNAYFSFADEYTVPGLKDAPPTHTKVVHTRGQKEISNQGGKAGPN